MSPKFEDTYLGQLRKVVGSRLIAMPGARAVIERDDGFILLEKRSDFGSWGLPAGNAEAGEDIRETIRRECMEEVGIEVLDMVPYAMATDPLFQLVTYPNGDQIHAFALNFHVTEWRGEPTPDLDETLEVGWYHPDDLPDMLINFRRAVEAFVAWRQTGQFQMI